MNVPAELRYATSHEWCRLEGDLATVGITDYAQDQLGDIVYVELPAVGHATTAGAAFGTIESVKAAEDLCAPVGGEVIEVNEAVADAVETINQDPYGEGWLIRIKVADPAEVAGLLDAEAYRAHCESEH